MSKVVSATPTAVTIAASPAETILRTPAVERLTGLSRTTLWREEKAGRFPQRVKLSANAVGWRYSEVQAWIHGRAVAGLNFSSGSLSNEQGPQL